MKRQKDIDYLRRLNPSAYKREMKRRSKLAVVNTETGEIAPYYEPIPILTDKQKRSLKDLSKLGQHHEENGGFVSVFYKQGKPMDAQTSGLTQSDYARLIYIATYTGYPEHDKPYGYLRYDNQHYIDKDGLFKLLQMSRNKFAEFYEKVKKYGILEETEEGEIIMNPFYFYRGEHAAISDIIGDRQSTRLYRKTIRQLYAEYNGRNIKRLGLIYAVLPFVNKNFNIIAHNPDEQDPNYVKPMRLGELADKLGYAKASALKTALKSIRYEGKAVFQFIEDDADNRKRKIIVNPSVIYGSNGQQLDAIKASFND
jgi:hypothetical protein